jgi:hypothetical protein
MRGRWRFERLGKGKWKEKEKEKRGGVGMGFIWNVAYPCVVRSSNQPITAVDLRAEKQREKLEDNVIK